MDRDALVEAMRDAIAPHMGCQDCGAGSGECPCRDAARAALAKAEPMVREWERDEIIALIDATPTPGEADDTESGHRYAAGYRDASNCAVDDLRRLRDRVVARTGGTP